MKNCFTHLLLLFFLIGTVACSSMENPNNKMELLPKKYAYEAEKKDILAVINNETKAAFNRDYEGWKDKWIHSEFVTKTYINFTDSSMTETLGFKEIDDFVRTYIEEHPEPSPLPKLVDDIEVRLYGNAAWVSYEQEDAERGLKRETRLMEKVNDEWKIAGMHTTIYGFNHK